MYRHSSTSLSYADSEAPPMALVIGGKESASTVFDGAYFYLSAPGPRIERLVQLSVLGQAPIPVSGAFLLSVPGCQGAKFSGIFGGGITDDGSVSDGLYSWSLDISDHEVRL